MKEPPSPTYLVKDNYQAGTGEGALAASFPGAKVTRPEVGASLRILQLPHLVPSILSASLRYGGGGGEEKNPTANVMLSGIDFSVGSPRKMGEQESGYILS